MEHPQLVVGVCGLGVALAGIALGLLSFIAGGACVAAFVALAAALPTLCTSAAASGIKYVVPRHGQPASAVRRLHDHIASCTGTQPAAWLEVVCRAEFIAPSCWALVYEALLAHSHLGRSAKESIALGISRALGARSCTHVHELTCAAGAQARAEGILDEDARMCVRDAPALEAWAASTATPVSAVMAEAGDARPLPFSLAQAPEVLAAVVVAHFQARVSRAFIDDTALLYSRLHPAVYRAFVRPFELREAWGAYFLHNERGAVFRDGAPAANAASLRSSDLPLERVEEELPSELRRTLAVNHALLLACEAWSRACARGARGVLRKESRDVVRRFVANGWESAGGYEWASAIAGTTPHENDRGLVRIALHTIAAPELIVDRDVVTEMNQHGDEAVIAVVAFAAAEAAKGIGNRVVGSLLSL